MKKRILIFILAVSVSVFGKENLNNVKIVSSSNVVTSNFSTTNSNFEKDRKDIIDLYMKNLKNISFFIIQKFNKKNKNNRYFILSL